MDPSVSSNDSQVRLASQGAFGCIHVVDDDVAVRIALARLLRTAGYTVATFASAEDFLEQAKPAQPDCVVLDLLSWSVGDHRRRRTLNLGTSCGDCEEHSCEHGEEVRREQDDRQRR